MRQVIKFLIIISAVLIFASFFNLTQGQAQAGSASDLINTVNALRQSQGLVPYTVDSFLMGFAQSHSDHMASLGTWTHTRADGTSAFDYGIKENVAMGMDLSVDYCVYTLWSDAVHWQTMVGFISGKVGAGVTASEGNVYYTLNVLPGDSTYLDNSNEDNNSITNNAYTQADTARIIQQVITSTPNEDGIITHIVQYGETLWTIAEAYGVPIDQILRNSGLSQATTEVFENQRLIIQTATEPTPTITPTPTEIPPTSTPTQPRPTMTPFPTRTPGPTGTATQPPSIIHQTLSDGKFVGMGLILFSGLGLILVLYLGFLKKDKLENKNQ